MTGKRSGRLERLFWGYCLFVVALGFAIVIVAFWQDPASFLASLPGAFANAAWIGVAAIGVCLLLVLVYAMGTGAHMATTSQGSPDDAGQGTEDDPGDKGRPSPGEDSYYNPTGENIGDAN